MTRNNYQASPELINCDAVSSAGEPLHVDTDLLLKTRWRWRKERRKTKIRCRLEWVFYFIWSRQTDEADAWASLRFWYFVWDSIPIWPSNYDLLNQVFFIITISLYKALSFNKNKHVTTKSLKNLPYQYINSLSCSTAKRILNIQIWQSAISSIQQQVASLMLWKNCF